MSKLNILSQQLDHSISFCDNESIILIKLELLVANVQSGCMIKQQDFQYSRDNI